MWDFLVPCAIDLLETSFQVVSKKFPKICENYRFTKKKHKLLLTSKINDKNIFIETFLSNLHSFCSNIF